ncbi:BatA domain-containing protein [Novipirellula sp.]|uniref:BatA domain-containing protein n=1 Tax=Novipirellula sp. TaxID=2795430 RepID=UPI003565D5DC
MTFLNATLMLGLAAAAVPIVLHFLSRREPKKVVFPSLRFLTQRYETNRSRLKIRRWWLLALRIAAIAAVAFALARPVIHQSLSLTWVTIGLVAAAGLGMLVLAGIAIARGFSPPLRYALTSIAVLTLLSAIIWGGVTYATGPRPATDSASPVAMAIVIDNSATSSWQTNSDDRMQRIESLAEWIVARVPRSSRIAVIDRSTSPASFALDSASALSQIEQIEPLAVTQPITSRIAAAIGLVQSSDLAARAVIVISDLSESTWQQAIDDPSTRQLLETEPTVNLTLVDLGEFTGTNRFVSSLQVSDLTPPAATSVSVSARVGIAGDVNQNGQSITAELELYDSDPALPVIRDGMIQRPELRSVDRTSVRLSGSGTAEVLLTVPPMQVGTHHGQIRLIGDDSIALDNVRYFSIEVLPSSPVLIVSDSEEEARVLGQSITAPLVIDDPNAEYRVESIRYQDFAVVRLADFDAVMLLDPPNRALHNPQLAQYIERGGGVFVSLGPAAEPTSEASPTWPKLVRRWRVPEPGTFLQPLNQSHPLLAPLSNIAGGVPWNQFRIAQYWQVETRTQDKVKLRRLAQFAGTEHASIVEVANEDAETPRRVVIMTTPLPALADATRRWNELFSGTDAWPAFLLVRELADYLTERSAGLRDTLVGQPHTITLASSDASAAATSIPVETALSSNKEADSQTAAAKPAGERLTRRYQLYPPGDTSSIPIDVDIDSQQFTVTNINSPGTYWVRGPGLHTGFSANIADNATRLARVDPESLVNSLGSEHVQLVTDREEIDLRGDQDSQRVSLHSPAMLLALVVFLLEQILGNRFYRKRDSARSSTKQASTAAGATA